jgi:hypothetical protein
MALAVRAAQTGKQKALVGFLIATIALGTVFLVVKGFEYHDKWVLHHVPGLNFQLEEGQVPQIAIFLSLYFALTGLHALHMVIGFVLMSVILWMAWRKRLLARVVHAGGDGRAVLALRGHRLDLPVPAAVPRGQGAPGAIAHVAHFSEEHLLRDLRGPDGPDGADGLRRVPAPGMAQLPGRRSRSRS